MTRVDFACIQTYLALLIEQLERGPGFRRLPPAHFWHGHKNEIAPKMRVGVRAPTTKTGETRFTVSRRKWMLDLPPEPLNVPVPLRMPAKAYAYCDMSAPLKRTVEALKILEDIEKSGGDICGEQRRRGRQGIKGCSKKCHCVKLDEHHGWHACEHGLFSDTH